MWKAHFFLFKKSEGFNFTNEISLNKLCENLKNLLKKLRGVNFTKEIPLNEISEKLGEGQEKTINAIDLQNFPNDFEESLWNRFVDEMDIENILVFTWLTILSNNDTAEISRYQEGIRSLLIPLILTDFENWVGDEEIATLEALLPTYKKPSIH